MRHVGATFLLDEAKLTILNSKFYNTTVINISTYAVIWLQICGTYIKLGLVCEIYTLD